MLFYLSAESALHRCSSENIQQTGDLVTFAEEILNGKLHFLCSESKNKRPDWLEGLVFVYKQSGSGFKSHCSHLIPQQSSSSASLIIIFANSILTSTHLIQIFCMTLTKTLFVFVSLCSVN